MKNFAEPISRLINELTKLPGVGAKTAQRYAYKIIKMDDQEAAALADAITEAKRNIKYCGKCGNFTDIDPCKICATRDKKTVCVVAEPKDVSAMEKVRDYGGTYHVLHGTISPMDSRGPDDIRIKELITRVSDDDISEVILATNPTIEGEATAVYIAKLMRTLGVKATRLAQGISMGSDLEYTDEVTLTQAMRNRKEL